MIEKEVHLEVYLIIKMNNTNPWSYSRLNLEMHNIASKIFLEIPLNSLINLFRFYFNLLYCSSSQYLRLGGRKTCYTCFFQIMTTRLTGGLSQGYKPKLPASA